MKISRQNLKRIVESFLLEDKKSKKEYICPNCGHVHKSEEDIEGLLTDKKCVKCGFSFEGKKKKTWKIKKWI